jgi:hypothetical protein
VVGEHGEGVGLRWSRAIWTETRRISFVGGGPVRLLTGYRASFVVFAMVMGEDRGSKACISIARCI